MRSQRKSARHVLASGAAVLALVGPVVGATAAQAADGQGDQAASAGTWHTTHYSGQRQQRDNWCGPAAAATVLTSWYIGGVSQSRLASQLHTNDLGFTAPSVIPGVLNRLIDAHEHWSSSTHPYDWEDNVGNNWLWDHAVADINKKRALMILVDPGKVPWDGGSWGEGHYLTIIGYNANYYGKRVYQVWDPAVGTTHTLSANDWTHVAWNHLDFGNFVIF